MPRISSQPEDTTIDTEDGLTDDERLVVEAFGNRFAPTQPENNSEPTSAEDLSEPTPSDPVPPAATADTDDPDREGLESSVSDTEPSTDTTPPPTTSPSTSDAPAPEQQPTDGGDTDGAAQPPPTVTVAGRAYTIDELTPTLEWLARLDTNTIRSIDLLMSGQYTLAPVSTPNEPQSSSPSPVVPAAGTPATTPSDASPDEEWLDPRAQQEISNLRNQLNALQQSLTPVVQTQQQTQLQLLEAQVAQGAESFASERGLTPEELNHLASLVNQAQIFPSINARFRSPQSPYGDPAKAMSTALDMMYWTTPEFRDRNVQSQVNDALTRLQDQDREDKVRQQQMTALATNGGSAPRRDPVPANAQDRHKAMVEMIAADQNGQ